MEKSKINGMFVFAILSVVLFVFSGVTTSAGSDDGMIYRPGAEYYIYSGKWSPDLDISKMTPVHKRVFRTDRAFEGFSKDPKAPKGDYFVVSRGYLRVKSPTNASKITPGYRNSTFNVMTINGKEVHRKNPGQEKSTYTPIFLPGGYHPYEIIWFLNKSLFYKMYGEPSNGRDVWHKVPFEKQMQTELLGSFAALKKHIKGTAVLNNDQIDVHKEKIKEHRFAFGHNRTIVKAALDMISTFENVKGALWRDIPEMNKRRGEPKGINWVMYNVMQFVMDEVYTADGLAKYEDLLDGYKYQCSDFFPGKVDPPANPDKKYTVKINGSHKKAVRETRLGAKSPGRKPTGAYLAPGSIATVTVPKAIVGKSYRVRVGSHSWDNTYKPRVARIGRCTTVFPINSTEIKVANPLGGGIYIEVPYLSDAGVVEVSVKNAVRSPYFSAKSFHKTTLEEWRNIERNFKAPWTDFQSDKFMMNVPTSWIYKLDDPVTLMKQWDKAMDGMNYLFGLPEIQGRETMYIQIDRQLRAGVHAPGYPSVNTGYDPRKDYGGYHNHHLIRGPRYASAYEFHERCHAFSIMHLLGEKEATVHLPHVAALNYGLGLDMDEAFRTSCVSYSNVKARTVDNNAISWMVGIYFSQKKPVVGVKYKHIGHVHWVDLARLFGWEALHKFYYSYNMDADNGIPHGDSVDKVARLCESAGADLRPLFHFWGRFYFWGGGNKNSAGSIKLQKFIDEKKLPASAKIYDALVRYKSMVPKNNKEFQEFTTKWWGRKPRITGYCHESGHARQWDSQVLKEPAVWPNGDIYDENSYARVKAYVQEIIDMYFPNGRPKK